MIRVLTMIAVAGFVLCVGSLAAAVAVGGPDALARGGWTFAEGGGWSWGPHHSYRHNRDGRWSSDDYGKDTTRTMAWSGAEGLEIDLPADVRYIQSPGAGTVELAGPERALQDVEIHGNSISYRHGFRRHGYPKISVTIRAPNIHAFDLSGRNSLQIENYRQARLDIDVSGEGDVTAVGEADEIALDVSGDADVDLAKLKTKGADVEISGAGDTTIAPTEWAQVKVSGIGDVRLLTQPKKLEMPQWMMARRRISERSLSPLPRAGSVTSSLVFAESCDSAFPFILQAKRKNKTNDELSQNRNNLIPGRTILKSWSVRSACQSRIRIESAQSCLTKR